MIKSILLRLQNMLLITFMNAAQLGMVVVAVQLQLWLLLLLLFLPWVATAQRDVLLQRWSVRQLVHSLTPPSGKKKENEITKNEKITQKLMADKMAKETELKAETKNETFAPMGFWTSHLNTFFKALSKCFQTTSIFLNGPTRPLFVYFCSFQTHF